MKAEKLGAVLYGLWGLAHVAGGAMMWFALSSEGSASYLSIVATAVDPAQLEQPVSAAAQSVLAFHAFNLMWLGALVTGVAVLMNWRNSVAGYWFNLVLVSAADIGLIVTTLLPGYMNVTDGLLGPVLAIGAAALTTVGLLRRRGERASLASATLGQLG